MNGWQMGKGFLGAIIAGVYVFWVSISPGVAFVFTDIFAIESRYSNVNLQSDVLCHPSKTV